MDLSGGVLPLCNLKFTLVNMISSCRNISRILPRPNRLTLSKRIKRTREPNGSYKECAIMPINQVLGGGFPQAFGGGLPRGASGGGGGQLDLNAIMELLQSLLSGQGGGGGASPAAAGGAGDTGAASAAGAGAPAAAGGCPSCKGKGCSRCQGGCSCPGCKGGCCCGGRGCSRCKGLGF